MGLYAKPSVKGKSEPISDAGEKIGGVRKGPRGEGVFCRQSCTIEQGYISESKWQEMRDGVRRAGVDRQGQAGQEQRGTARAGDGDPARLQRFYHGSTDEITPGFNLDHPNRKDAGWLGDGVYFTDDTNPAESYANLKAGTEGPIVLPLAI